MRENTLNWYHHYLNHPSRDRLGNMRIKETFYWKGLSNQARRHLETCQVYQQHKNKCKCVNAPSEAIEDLVVICKLCTQTALDLMQSLQS